MKISVLTFLQSYSWLKSFGIFIEKLDHFIPRYQKTRVYSGNTEEISFFLFFIFPWPYISIKKPYHFMYFFFSAALIQVFTNFHTILATVNTCCKNIQKYLSWERIFLSMCLWQSQKKKKLYSSKTKPFFNFDFCPKIKICAN